MLIGRDHPPLTQSNILKEREKKKLDKYKKSPSFAMFFHSLPLAELPVPLRKHLESLSEATALKER